MTPQEVRCYAYHTAKDFSQAVSQVLSLARNEASFQQALDIWQKSSMALFINVCQLRESAWSSSLSQMAADESLDLIHMIVIGTFVDTDLVHSLSICAWHCMDESDALEFENRFSDYFFQLFLQLNPPTNPPTHIRTEVFRPDCSWNSVNGMVVLCGGKAEVTAKGDSEGNASIGGRVEINHETEKGTKYSAEASASVEKDKNGQTSGKVEVKAGVSWDQ